MYHGLFVMDVTFVFYGDNFFAENRFFFYIIFSVNLIFLSSPRC